MKYSSKWILQSLALCSSARPALALAEPKPRIVVIGGGAAGLASARVLSRNGYDPIVLEKESIEGGVWKYRKNSRTKPVYRGLRTNLPKEVMSYREFPWPPINDDPLEDPSFLTHGQVLDYLLAYKHHFGLDKLINRGCTVTKLQVLSDTESAVSPSSEVWPQIQLEWENQQTQKMESGIFDAVLVCNGHYAKPSIPELPGADQYFKGRRLHSIEYDDPTEFANQQVLCIGARASGEDLAREISLQPGTHVYLSSSTYPRGQRPKTQESITLVPRTVEVKDDGSVCFDGSPESVSFDAIIYCTGYDYSFPFIHDPDLLEIVPGERRVKPLYAQLFHAKYPNLSFIGLPHSVVPFPLFEFQAEAVVAQFQGRSKLPYEKDRMDSAARDAVAGGPTVTGRIQNTHHLGSAQWDYARQLAELSGLYGNEIEAFIETSTKIYDHTGGKRKGRFPGSADDYREIFYRRDDAKKDFSIRNLMCAKTAANKYQ